ncbi:hypothetical protein ES707_21030 [subsurface metagenome]
MIRTGELLAGLEPKLVKESSAQRTSLPSLPPDIDKKRSHLYQQAYKYCKKIMEAFDNALPRVFQPLPALEMRLARGMKVSEVSRIPTPPRTRDETL